MCAHTSFLVTNGSIILPNRYSVYSLTFDFQAADTDDPSNGPGGQDCAGGTDEREDRVEFDGEYVIPFRFRIIHVITNAYCDGALMLDFIGER